jgi:alkylated DNA repair dioxygenase AlkB
MDTFQQISIFGHNPTEPAARRRVLSLPDADIWIEHGFFSGEDSDRLFHQLDQQTRWRQDYIQLFDKTLPIPRLTAWYGDPGKPYTYSGIAMHPDSWTATLLAIKTRVEAAVGRPFNSVLLNKYRTGRDSVAWHSDDEPELGPQPVIASVSFGATRRFRLKHKYNQAVERVSLDLPPGSLLLMGGTTQQCWLHQVPKTTKAVGPRINLTFRWIA